MGRDITDMIENVYYLSCFVWTNPFSNTKDYAGHYAKFILRFSHVFK